MRQPFAFASSCLYRRRTLSSYRACAHLHPTYAVDLLRDSTSQAALATSLEHAWQRGMDVIELDRAITTSVGDGEEAPSLSSGDVSTMHSNNVISYVCGVLVLNLSHFRLDKLFLFCPLLFLTILKNSIHYYHLLYNIVTFDQCLS